MHTNFICFNPSKPAIQNHFDSRTIPALLRFSFLASIRRPKMATSRFFSQRFWWTESLLNTTRSRLRGTCGSFIGRLRFDRRVKAARISGQGNSVLQYFRTRTTAKQHTGQWFRTILLYVCKCSAIPKLDRLLDKRLCTDSCIVIKNNKGREATILNL